MPVGRVKWYDKSKGYGFIESPEGDVFFHFSDILMDGFKALAEEQRVSYKICRCESGLKAQQIHPLDQRAGVRHAARYRTVLLMKIKSGRQGEFDDFFMNPPPWFDAMEQELGIRRIGTWRCDTEAISLLESDKPYEQSIEAARGIDNCDEFEQWQNKLSALLIDEPAIMAPVEIEAMEVAEELAGELREPQGE